MLGRDYRADREEKARERERKGKQRGAEGERETERRRKRERQGKSLPVELCPGGVGILKNVPQIKRLALSRHHALQAPQEQAEVLDDHERVVVRVHLSAC